MAQAFRHERAETRRARHDNMGGSGPGVSDLRPVSSIVYHLPCRNFRRSRVNEISHVAPGRMENVQGQRAEAFETLTTAAIDYCYVIVIIERLSVQ